MKIIEFHKRVMKIMKTFKLQLENYENNSKQKITFENNENHDILEFHLKITNIMKS